ncbi:uncharacterized protein TRUGW13939_10154 [Talaromyces rugulosus]|uniref:Uncharacterized protein n=1 Tax=Talaromyces rugulosus TaxID=121627 RepID=A0A7H8R9K8_TALRU|nr:uncharacterized protein TRUGW13939_10154 [Talaromyces rugulosus]QKX62986.1 hypothetical protein TRUGW13939_10154 [Talaromyces rugulosus]
MTASAQFQLFPSPAKNKKNPFRTTLKKQEQSPVSPLSATESKSGIQAESVIIQIVEDTKTVDIKAPPKAHVTGGAPPTTTTENTYNQDSNSPSRQGTSPSLSQGQTLRPANNQQRRASPVSPGMPIRSMFPQYDPNLPLNEQPYFPQTGNADKTTGPSGSGSGRPENTMAVPQAEVDVLLGPKTVPASVLNFPSDELSPRMQYSTAEDLLTLWESANGQQLQESLGTFNLRAERTDTATFTFGDPQLPFYTLQASTNGLSVMRNHPFKANRGVQVMALAFEDPGRRQPPHDGLVTVIFSKLAAMLAVEQAAELTRQHRLAPSEAVEVETHAVTRAASQESCRLIWNERQNRYELQHPSLLKQHSPELLGDDGNPLSRVQTKKPGILHISVSPSSDSESLQPPTIVVTCPTPPNNVRAADTAATPRTSTLPQADNDEPLAWFDLGTMSLSICAGLTTRIIPSLYAIDSLVAAILTVAVTDPATNPILANTEMYVPSLGTPRTPPGSGGNSSRKNRIRASIATTAQRTNASFSGKLFATLAEREDAEEEAKLMAQIRASEAKEKKSKDKKKSRGGFSLFRKKEKKTTTQKPKQIVVEEFDLEKYGHFGKESSRQGDELPGVARVLVSMLVFGLELVVTVLSAGVKCAVWMVVNLTRCVTSEKF